LRAAKSRFEQAEVDARCEFAVFEASKERETEREIAQLQNQRQHELRLADLEQQGVQGEMDHLHKRHQQRMNEHADVQRSRIAAIEHDFDSEKSAMVRESESEEAIALKDGRIGDLTAVITECESKKNGRDPIHEDTEQIARLEDFVRERREAVGHMAKDYCFYEGAKLDPDVMFDRIASGQTPIRFDSRKRRRFLEVTVGSASGRTV
jgi:hypothetical protein